MSDEQFYRCHKCLDDQNGWRIMKCTGLTCGRERPHQPHEFSVRCRCWLERNADAIRRHGQQVMSKGGFPPASLRALEDLDAGRYPWDASKL